MEERFYQEGRCEALSVLRVLKTGDFAPFRIDPEFSFMKGDEPFPFHPSKLPRQGGAFRPQIVRELLSVQGDGKMGGAVYGGLLGKIGIQPVADLFGRGMKNPHGKPEIFPRRDNFSESQ